MNSFSIDGSQFKPIAIDYYPVEASKAPTIIFVHGFKGFKDWGTHHLVAHFFNTQGFNFLKFNFSHNGISIKEKENFDDLKSFGENTFSKELFDLDEVITFTLSEEAFTRPSKLFLLGHSLGGGISILQAAEDPRISKLVTWASVSRFNNLWQATQEEQWRTAGVIYTTNTRTKQQMPLNITLLEDFEHHSEKLNINNAAKSLTQPWLIIHGDKDSGVPVAQAEELHRQNSASVLKLIEDADHVFGAKHPWTESHLPDKLNKVCEITSNFFSESYL